MKYAYAGGRRHLLFVLLAKEPILYKKVKQTEVITYKKVKETQFVAAKEIQVRHEVDERLLRQEKALEDVQQQNELLKQQNELLKQQMNYLLKVTDTQFPSSSRQLNEDDDEEDVYRPVFND
ncbi:hypothetical protein E3N88_06072 [Mikania micrantha]|uniref:Uncharacterized protein n=1 Tax=Mikania micrantha TaxID=192012 RepID=A0A5N6PNU1_9ASTR|nr:hypothetical protein E3N88_06072 [Mikania micrantha]